MWMSGCNKVCFMPQLFPPVSPHWFNLLRFITCIINTDISVYWRQTPVLFFFFKSWRLFMIELHTKPSFLWSQLHSQLLAEQKRYRWFYKKNKSCFWSFWETSSGEMRRQRILNQMQLIPQVSLSRHWQGGKQPWLSHLSSLCLMFICYSVKLRPAWIFVWLKVHHFSMTC